MKKFKIILGIIGIILLIGILINVYIESVIKKHIYSDINNVPKSYTGLVLGAFVSERGTPSYVLRQRLDKAVELYKAGKIERILVSGDHGKKNYDEVNGMKEYLLKNGIPLKDIFLDHAGFDTYSSMVRAKEIFEVDSVIIITQKFHLPRSVYIARKKGLNAYGVVANTDNKYENIYNQGRDKISRVKAFFDVAFGRKPKYLGEKIPINGDNKKTLD